MHEDVVDLYNNHECDVITLQFLGKEHYLYGPDSLRHSLKK